MISKIGYNSFTCQIIVLLYIVTFPFLAINKSDKVRINVLFFCCAVCSNKWDQGGLIPLDFSKDQTGPKLFFGTMVTDFILT